MIYIEILSILVGMLGFLGFYAFLIIGYTGSFLLYSDLIYKSEKLYVNIIIAIFGAIVLGILWIQHIVIIFVFCVMGVIYVLADKYKIANMWDEYEKKE